MAISTKLKTQQTRSPQPQRQPQQALPEVTIDPSAPLPIIRVSAESNGYLDPGQSVVNYAIREVGLTLEGLIQEDPQVILRDWLKTYKLARGVAIGTAAVGGGGFLFGIMVGATPLLFAGIGVAALGGFGLKHHQSGVSSISAEYEALDHLRPVLDAMYRLERSGVNPSHLVSLYDRMLRRFLAAPDYKQGNPRFLADALKIELENGGLTDVAKKIGKSSERAEKRKELPQAVPAPMPIAPTTLQTSDDLAAIEALETYAANANFSGFTDDFADVPVVAEKPVVEATDFIRHVALNPKSSFFAAPARLGKGVTVTACIRATQKQVGKTLKGVTFWAYTPKQDRRENWYWETCDRTFNPDIENGDKTLAAKGLYLFINEFSRLRRDDQNPTILIIDEFSRTLGLLSGVRMCDVDPDLYAKDTKTAFTRWLTDKCIYSASMSQSVGYYVWVVTPKDTIGTQNFDSSDVASLNIYTFASRTNTKFASAGRRAAFSAPEISLDHPVLHNGYAAAYCHQSAKWFPIPSYGDTPDKRTKVDPPVRLKHVWQAPWEKSARVATIAPQNRFEMLAVKLTGEKSRHLRSLVEWLATQQGQTLTAQSLVGWCKSKGIQLNQETFTKLIQGMVDRKLITPISNREWQVANG
jgi:hypothetical protein